MAVPQSGLQRPMPGVPPIRPVHQVSKQAFLVDARPTYIGGKACASGGVRLLTDTQSGAHSQQVTFATSSHEPGTHTASVLYIVMREQE